MTDPERDEPPEHLDRLARTVLLAAIEVHRHLGPGFLESVYETALVLELEARGIAVARQVPVTVMYKGRSVAESRLDLVVEDELVVELKAADALLPIHHAQVISYLKAGAFELGLLINFNVPLLPDGFRRIVWHPR